MIAPEQIQLAHDLALSLGIAVLLYAFIAKPLWHGVAYILRRTPQRKATRNDQPARRGPSTSGGELVVSLSEHEDAIAEAFARGIKFQQQRHRHTLYAVDAPTAEIFHLPINEETAS